MTVNTYFFASTHLIIKKKRWVPTYIIYAVRAEIRIRNNKNNFIFIRNDNDAEYRNSNAKNDIIVKYTN